METFGAVIRVKDSQLYYRGSNKGFSDLRSAHIYKSKKIAESNWKSHCKDLHTRYSGICDYTVNFEVEYINVSLVTEENKND